MNVPTLSFDPFLKGKASPAEATMWLVRDPIGEPLGYVEKAGDRRFSAHRHNKFYGPFPTREAAGLALEQADAQEAGA